MKVTHISASGNRFSQFAQSFVSTPSLEYLDLSSNHYTSLNEAHLQQFPPTCQVCLRDNPLDEASVQLAKKYKFIL